MTSVQRAHPVLLSSYLPSGATYPLNILLSLGIPVYPHSFSAFWHGTNAGYYLDEYARFRLQKVFPAMNDLQGKVLNAGIAVEWAHDFPLAHYHGRPMLLFVRDGRDVLYSHYKRTQAAGPLDEFILKRMRPFGFTLVDDWILYSQVYLAALQVLENTMLVKFEDLKLNPLSSMQALLAFIGVQHGDDELNMAIEASDTRKARLNFEKHEARDLVKKEGVMIRKGQPNEWRETWTPEQLALLPRRFWVVSSKLGYEVPDGITVDLASAPSPSALDRTIASQLYRQLFSNCAFDETQRATFLGVIESFVTECRADGEFQALQRASSKAGPFQDLVVRQQLVKGNKRLLTIFHYHQYRKLRRIAFHVVYRVMSVLYRRLATPYPRLWRRLLAIVTYHP